ncbi:aminotransferase class IV [Luminiphilus sp.]|nr:aminotransferase class IV [Luminiphilus sp.]MDA9579977.1 aminotransferase class IV [Luminiphilus sp.]MDB2615746.1 aminotransferase class IV [Luminiphilus sp.]MDB3923431.1 aminotransferase class IV [Luminiphilus sp.]
MTIAYLNGEFVPLEEARISPMDRGFLFGDGIYEVIPSYNGQLVGFKRHMQRLDQGLAAIQLENPLTADKWHTLFSKLTAQNAGDYQGVYLQVTRGTSPVRNHRFPVDCQPTVFAYTFTVNAPCDGDPDKATCYQVATATDRRWKRCDIKSVALLGNVLHMMEGVDSGADEIILFNEQEELTEAAACNVFIVQNKTVITPPLDIEKLPGVTRNMLVDILRGDGWSVEERAVSRTEVMAADEVWLTSSTKEIAPVIAIDGHSVSGGKAGAVWAAAQSLFAHHRYSA